jgi:predicted TPR repeat methyltransferase
MNNDKRNNDYRDSHLNKGEEYDEKFKDNSYRALLWDIEKKILKKIISKFFAGRIDNYLDFACGTGRVLSFIEQYSDHSIGIDVSESMLSVARNNINKSKIILGDITKDSTILNNIEFDLISAFRFFPNAQTELCVETLMIFNKMLKNEGYLVFNNHRNHHNLIINRLKRFIKYLINKKHTIIFSESEIKDLLDKCGFKIVKKYHSGVFNVIETKKVSKNSILTQIEKLCMNIPFSKYFSHNVIYVVEKCKLK